MSGDQFYLISLNLLHIMHSLIVNCMVCIHDIAYPQVTYTALCTMSPFFRANLPFKINLSHCLELGEPELCYSVPFVRCTCVAHCVDPSFLSWSSSVILTKVDLLYFFSLGGGVCLTPFFVDEKSPRFTFYFNWLKL